LVEQIIGYITTEILKDPSRQISEDQPLISSGLIDSFGLVDLALFVEESFGVCIEDVELTASVFDTTQELTQLISQKLGNSTL
jgi:acyl carrier protein